MPLSRGALSQDCRMAAKHVNKKNAGKPRVLGINALLLSRRHNVESKYVRT